MPRQRQLLASIGAGERELPVLARETLDELHNRLPTLDTRILAYDRKIAALARQSEPAHDDRGIGPVTASALVTSVGEAKAFRTGHEFAAWLGLTPARTPAAARPG